MSDNTKSFSESFKELEEIVDYFNQEVTDIDESIAKFERGVELSQELKTYLEESKNKVEKIKKKFDGDQ